METVNNLKQLVASGRTRDAIKKLLAIFLKEKEGHKDLYHMTILLSARYNELNNRNISGRSTTQEYNIEKNRLNNSLLQLIDKIRNENKNSSSISKNLNPDNIEISIEDAKTLKKHLSFLIVTVTDTEQKEVLKNLKPLPNFNNVLTTYKDNLTFNLGVFGVYGVVVVQSGMGATPTDGSINTISAAIDVWKPKAVVMIGIAFGVDNIKQQIGDVLISGKIIPYDLRREGKTTIFRSEVPSASLLLRNRFQSIAPRWDYTLPSGKKAKYKICEMLSGDVLIDNLEFRNELLKVFPEKEAKWKELEFMQLQIIKKLNGLL